MISEEYPEESRRTWLVSFADLISLLLTFMVMLFATADVDQPGWQSRVNTLAETLDWPGREAPSEQARFGVEQFRPVPALDLDYLAMVLRTTTLADDPLLAAARIQRHDDRLVVSMGEYLLFAPGDTRLSESARQALAGLAATLGGVGNRLGVEGHTDSQPVAADGRYASNWELSLARALAVAAALSEAGLRRPIPCYGLADSRDIELGDSVQGDGLAAGRRVDLVLFANAGDEK